MGNFYLDMWRVVAYMFVPAALLMGVVLMADGVPMTLDGAASVTTVEPGAMDRTRTAGRSSSSRSPEDPSRRSCPSNT